MPASSSSYTHGTTDTGISIHNCAQETKYYDTHQVIYNHIKSSEFNQETPKFNTKLCEISGFIWGFLWQVNEICQNSFTHVCFTKMQCMKLLQERSEGPYRCSRVASSAHKQLEMLVKQNLIARAVVDKALQELVGKVQNLHHSRVGLVLGDNRGQTATHQTKEQVERENQQK